MPAKSIKRFFGFSKSSTGRKASKDLEKMLADYSKTYNKVIKILLLGSGESGKTTIIKQMKILHVQGFNEQERLEAVQVIRENTYECISTLVNQMAIMQIPLGDKGNLISWKYIRNMSMTNNIEFTPTFFEHVRRLWNDAGVQECFARASEYSIPDCARFFLDRVYTIADNNFIPNDQFLLHSRRTTIGIQKIEFEVPIPKKYGGGASQQFWMFDVGGQRGERRKWIQVFDGIQSVLFLVACNTFDQMMSDSQPSEPTNRLREAMQIFQDVWISRFLKDAGFIVFLNKQDLLKDKINAGKCIGDFFPEYHGYSLVDNKDGDNDDEYVRTRCFIRDMFLLATDGSPPPTPRRNSPSVSFQDVKVKPQRELFFHFTTATDTNNIQTVFEDVHSMILIKNLRDIGFA